MIDEIPEVTAPSELSSDSYIPESAGPEIVQLSEQPPLPPIETKSAVAKATGQAERKLKDNEYKNMAALRQKAEQAERERDEALKRLQERDQETEEVTLGEDDIAEGKHLKKLQKNYHKEIRQLKDELNSYRKQSVEVATEAKLKATYTDFDSVVTADHLTTLKESYPELDATIRSAPDLYSQAVTAYTMIKKLGIAADTQYAGDREKAQTNAYKPRPATSISPQQGDNPLTRANAFADGLTDQLKEQLRKEMYSAIKNH